MIDYKIGKRGKRDTKDNTTLENDESYTEWKTNMDCPAKLDERE